MLHKISENILTHQDSPSKLINLIWYILSILFKSPSLTMTSASLLISSNIVKCLSLKSFKNVRNHKSVRKYPSSPTWSKQLACSCETCKCTNLCLRSPVPIFLTFSFHFNSVFVYLILSSCILLIFLPWGSNQGSSNCSTFRSPMKKLSSENWAVCGYLDQTFFWLIF